MRTRAGLKRSLGGGCVGDAVERRGDQLPLGRDRLQRGGRWFGLARVVEQLVEADPDQYRFED